MFLSTAAKYISLSWEIIKINILSAMEYRISFLTQVFGMIVNDVGFALLWVIFFLKFPSVNGWTFQDSALLFAISTVSFSFVMISARGAHYLARNIAKGELDYFLSFPKNVLWHVSISKTEISAIGDLIFGFIIFFFSGSISFEKFGLFLLVSVFAAIIFFGFTIITQSLSFYFGNFEEAADQLFHALLGFTLYPQTTFYGALKFIMFTIIPAFFVATLPVELIKNFSWKWFLVLVVFAICIFIAAVIVFNRGLKKYESGNLINVKM